MKVKDNDIVSFKLFMLNTHFGLVCCSVHTGVLIWNTHFVLHFFIIIIAGYTYTARYDHIGLVSLALGFIVPNTLVTIIIQKIYTGNLVI